VKLFKNQDLLINKYKSRFYMLGPNIDDISEGFAEKYNAEFIKTKYSLVDNRTIDKSSIEFGDRGVKKIAKENALFKLLWELKDEQTIIYCSSPEKTRYLSKLFCNYLVERGVPKSDNLSLVEWIRLNVDSKWGLIDCLNYKIGIHDGALQKHITSSIIDYFNENKLSYLFCTTTIIEGVNTSAKNVVFFSKTKGWNKPIDFFDYSNIKGRSGRMMVHYVGRIYNFNKPPEKDQIIIDIPFFDQKKVTDEVLIHIDDENVKNKESEQFKKLKTIPEEERELFKKNGVLVNGQKNIVEILERDIQKKHHLISWKYKPNYQQLSYVLSLTWNNLLKKGETTMPMTIDKLVLVTFNYGNDQDINQLVSDNYRYFRTLQKNNKKSDEELFDDAVTDAFKILRHWFHYKVPKWLNVMNSLQKYVCEKHDLEPGNYTYYSTQLENDFVRENLSILIEYGIPRSAVDKLTKHIPGTMSEEVIIEEIKSKKLFETSGLIEYEKEKLMENL
jgi:hypothetical protein